MLIIKTDYNIFQYSITHIFNTSVLSYLQSYLNTHGVEVKSSLDSKLICSTKNHDIIFPSEKFVQTNL